MKRRCRIQAGILHHQRLDAGIGFDPHRIAVIRRMRKLPLQLGKERSTPFAVFEQTLPVVIENDPIPHPVKKAAV